MTTQEKIRFIHTTDWHLGYSQYNLTKRYQDFTKAATKAVELIVKTKPDFVLHTGDVFHHFRPPAGAIRDAIHLFQQIKDAGIPVYTIRGNHDSPTTTFENRGGNVLHLLEDLELITLVEKGKVLETEKYAITGIGYYGNRTFKHLQNMMDEGLTPVPGKFNILALHELIQGQLQNVPGIPVENFIDLGYDYIGIGHYHVPWFRPDKRIYCPGSIEHTNAIDWDPSRRNDKGFTDRGSQLLVEAVKQENGSWEIKHDVQYISTRPKKRVQKTITGNDKNEALATIKAIIEENDVKDAIIIFNFTIDVPQARTQGITREKLQEYVHNALRAEFRIQFKDLDTEVSVKARKPREILHDLIKENVPTITLQNHVQDLTQYFIDHVLNDQKNEDELKDEIIKMFEEEITHEA